MKTLYSCGCSYLSSDNRVVQPSFLDMYAETKNFQHITLAKPGASNFVIRLQIDRAIQNSADFVVVGATSSDRMDLDCSVYKRNGPINLDHVVYHGYGSQSEQHIDSSKGFIISNVIGNLIERDHRVKNSEMKQAMKSFLAHCYSVNLNYHKDYFVIRDGLWSLRHAGIPFVFIPGPLKHLDWSDFCDTIWQEAAPWDMPDGEDQRAVNHNYQSAHNKFCSYLQSITKHWH